MPSIHRCAKTSLLGLLLVLVACRCGADADDKATPAAGAPLLRLVTGLSETQLHGILAARTEAPFETFRDFLVRTKALHIANGTIGVPL